MSERIRYGREQDLDVAEFRRVLVDSGLGRIRPVDDEPRLQAMLTGANLIVTARLDQPGRPLVGVGRAVTDSVWCCYLSDLAVSPRPRGSASARACWTRRAGSSGRR